MSLEHDYDLRHIMRDVVVLLGGEIEVADLLDKSQDGVTEADVEKARAYAIKLFTANKQRLAALHKLKLNNEPPQ